MDWSDGPKEPMYAQITTRRGNFEGKKGPVKYMPGYVRRRSAIDILKAYSARDADWDVVLGCTTWRIRLSHPCAAAMQPYVKLL